MQMRNIPIVGCMVFGSMILLGQGPISDVVKVTLPQATQVGSHLAQAGEYQIRQLSTASSPRLLEFSTSDGTKFETSVTAIPTLDNNNRKETSVVLEQRGNQQFLKQIWIAGKSYGYEIPVDESKIVRDAPESRRLVATYETAAPLETASAAPSTESAPAPVADAEPAPARVADAEPAPARVADAEPTPAIAPDPAPSPAPAPNRASTRDEVPQNTPQMPATADGWAGMLALGLALAGAAGVLRKVSRQ